MAKIHGAKDGTAAPMTRRKHSDMFGHGMNCQNPLDGVVRARIPALMPKTKFVIKAIYIPVFTRGIAQQQYSLITLMLERVNRI
jgi:hypothetical protein